MDHLPLYSQSVLLEWEAGPNGSGAGVELQRATAARWVTHLGWLVAPVMPPCGRSCWRMVTCRRIKLRWRRRGMMDWGGMEALGCGTTVIRGEPVAPASRAGYSIFVWSAAEFVPASFWLGSRGFWTAIGTRLTRATRAARS